MKISTNGIRQTKAKEFLTRKVLLISCTARLMYIPPIFFMQLTIVLSRLFISGLYRHSLTLIFKKEINGIDPIV